MLTDKGFYPLMVALWTRILYLCIQIYGSEGADVPSDPYKAILNYLTTVE